MSSPSPPPSPSVIPSCSPPGGPLSARASQSPEFVIDLQSPSLGTGPVSPTPRRTAHGRPNDNDDGQHSLPGTPPPLAINPWTENQSMQLVAFLSTSRGPLTIADVSNHMERPAADAAAMVVSVWQAALAVVQQRETRVPWWVGRPLSNAIGLRRSVVLTVDSGVAVLVFYGTDATEGTQMPIAGPEQMYEASQIQQ